MKCDRWEICKYKSTLQEETQSILEAMQTFEQLRRKTHKSFILKVKFAGRKREEEED